MALGTGGGTPPPDLKRFTSYREFIGAFYRHRKSLGRGFSFRLFAKRAGMKSPNYLQLVMQGRRHLSAEAAARVAAAMSLRGPEAEYFEALVGREGEREGVPGERALTQRRVLRAMSRLVARELPRAQAGVLSTWYHLVVRELVFLPDFAPDPTWISRRLRGLVTPEQAEGSLELLIRGGFLEPDSRGRLRAKDPVIDTGDRLGAARVLKTHRETLAVWRRLLEELDEGERELGLLNIPIASAKIPEFKRRIRAFQDEIIGWLQDEQNPDTIAQLGTYLVPLTSCSSEKRSRA